MIHFVMGLYEAVTNHKDCNVLIIGRDSVGKTTLMEQLKHMFGKGHQQQSSSEQSLATKIIRPTVGLNVAHLTFQGHSVKLWDLGGLASLRSMWTSYYRGCNGVLYVIDETATDLQFAEDHAILRSLLLHKLLCGAPIAIFANKTDVATIGASPKERLGTVQDKLGLLDLVLSTRSSSATCDATEGSNVSSSCGAGSKVFKLFEGSAKRGDGLDAAFRWLIEQCASSSRAETIDDDT